MAVVSDCVIAREVVSKVEDQLRVDSDTNYAGDGCEGECSVQDDFVVPPDSSLVGEQEGEEWWYENSGSGWVCEEV